MRRDVCRASGLMAVVASISCATVPSAPGRDAPSEASHTSGAPAVADKRPASDLEPLRRLRAAVDALPAGGGEEVQSRLPDALNALGDALERLSHAHAGAVAQIRAASTTLKGGGVAAAERAEGALDALARAATEMTPPPRRIVDYQAAVAALDAAVKSLSTTTPLEDQAGRLVAVLRAGTDALFLAANEPAPYDGRAAGLAPDGRSPESFGRLVAEARASVSRVAKSKGQELRQALGDALAQLADAIEARAGAGARVDKSVAELRFQASRLRRADAFGFDQAGWQRRGLTAALDALDVILPQRAEAAASWIQVAREAVESIDGRSAFTFQRAIVQDALRTVVDAFVVVAQPQDCR